MRDIRADLSDRLKEISKTRERLMAEVAELEERERMYRALLKDEGARFEIHQPSLFSNPRNQSGSALGNFLLDALSDGRLWSLSELKAAALERGMLTDRQSPGRALNFALVGLQQHGYVTRDGRSGRWALASRTHGAEVRPSPSPQLDSREDLENPE